MIASAAGSVAEVGAVIRFDREELRAVYAFPPDAVLDVEHVALWLGISVKTAEALPIKWLPIGGRGKKRQRFLRRAMAKHVIEYLESEAK